MLEALQDRFAGDDLVIIYDGGCPFCSSYVRLTRLRENVGRVRLVNARDDVALCKALLEAGYDLDEGMVMLHEGRIHHGAACLERMAALERGETWFGRLTRGLFAPGRAARALYPAMVRGRNLTLALLRRPRLWSPGDRDR